jgi:hypothetical protein
MRLEGFAVFLLQGLRPMPRPFRKGDVWQLPAASRQLPGATASCQLLTASCPLPSCQLPAATCQLPAASCQPPAASCHRPVASRQPPAATCHLPAASFRLSLGHLGGVTPPPTRGGARGGGGGEPLRHSVCYLQLLALFGSWVSRQHLESKSSRSLQSLPCETSK